jgi:hypothetical protein
MEGKVSAESALQCVGPGPAVEAAPGMNRAFSADRLVWGENLGRCPRLRMNRAFSAGGVALLEFLGRCPRLMMNRAFSAKTAITGSAPTLREKRRRPRDRRRLFPRGLVRNLGWICQRQRRGLI